MKFYYDLMSQPSRALYIFFKLNNVPVEYVQVALRKGEHLQDEFKAVNRFQKVPCIVDDDGWKLAETVAIFRYLMEKNPGIAEHWYPKNVRSRALVDEYLSWQHTNTRMACAMYFQTKWLIPLMTNKPPNETKLVAFKNHMESTLDLLENVWLQSTEKQFLATDEISFADILAACELEQPKMADYNPFDGRPKLTKWYAKVKALTSPFYDEAHAVINKIIDSNNKKPKL